MLRSIFILLAPLLIIAPCSGVKTLPTIPEDSNIGSEKGALHIVTTTECGSRYFIFQAWAQKYTLDSINQPGNYTRIISCDTPEELTEEDLSYMDTMVVPNWTTHPTNGDVYQAYNRPVALVHWLAERRPTAEWTLILDPDMLLRQPFLLKDFAVPEGFAVASKYSYLRGVMNELAERHISEIIPREDEYGGPEGRKADMAGAFMLIRTTDLVEVAPLWLKYTEDVRMDPMTIIYTGYGHEKVGEKQWASEMYGYVYAAAVVGVWHKLESTAQYYPAYAPQDIPVLIHYGLNHTIGDDYYFDKHVHLNFDAMRCPPWNLEFTRHVQEDAGLFPHPPMPVLDALSDPREKYGQLLVTEVVNTLNQALCTRHRKQCPASHELEVECGEVDAIARSLEIEFEKLHVPGVICHNNHESCDYWKENGECEKTWAYMIDHCRESCKRCRTYTPKSDPIRAGKNTGLNQTSSVKKEKTEEANQQEQNPDEIQKQDSKDHRKQDIIDREASLEVLRCQSLGRKSFLRDSNCQKLAAEGTVKVDWSPFNRISFEESSITQQYSKTGNFYPLTLISITLVALLLLFRKCFYRQNKTTCKRQ